MAKRAFSIFVLLTLVTVSAALLAAPRATLTLRNGDKFQTQLIDLGGVGFTIRSGAANETLPEADVAFIDFAGAPVPAGEINAMQNGVAFVALRNGDMVLGRLIDIGGNDPLRLTVRTSNGNQDFTSNDVARIFLSKWNGMPGPVAGTDTGRGTGRGAGQGTGTGQVDQGTGRGRARGQNNTQGQSMGQAQGRLGQGQTFVLPADQCWVRTGIFVDAGQRVTFAVTGQIQLSGDPRDVAGPAGSVTGRKARVAPLPDDLLGAFIIRIDRRTYNMGDPREPVAMPVAGELWIGINDEPCGDNRGEFRVTIRDGR